LFCLRGVFVSGFASEESSNQGGLVCLIDTDYQILIMIDKFEKSLPFDIAGNRNYFWIQASTWFKPFERKVIESKWTTKTG